MSVHFTPEAGKAEVSARIRLARTQNVIAYAEMSDGSVWSAQTEAKVTIGGCGG
jgi:sulfur-oxidizing protein SoxY